MAEKGILVQDDTTGESVACRDAVQADSDSNDRIIQLVDRAARPVSYQLDTPLRSAVSASDSFDLSPTPTGVYNSALDVSDAESCVVWATIDPGNTLPTDGFIVVTPIILSGEYNSCIAALAPIQISPVYPQTLAGSVSGTTDLLSTNSYTFLTCAQAFQTLGASKIGFHITIVESLDDGFSISLFAAATSSAYRNVGLDQKITDGTWGSLFIK